MPSTPYWHLGFSVIKVRKMWGIGQGVGAMDALGVQGEAVDTAHELAAVRLLAGHAALGDVHVIPPDADAVGVLHVVSHHGALHHPRVVEPQAEDAPR